MLKYKQSTALVRGRIVRTPPTGRIGLKVVPNPDKPEKCLKCLKCAKMPKIMGSLRSVFIINV